MQLVMIQAVMMILLVSFANGREMPDFDRLVSALVQVESGGRNHAVGDGGRAVGCLQMWPNAVDEVNRISGKKKFSYADRKNPVKSRAMCRITLLWHHKRNPKLTDVQLMGKWRNPFSRCPEWYLNKCSKALKGV